jgi:purine-binding chemotaxis protein CheW
VIPLVDLRSKFCLPISADTERNCIVVTQIAAAGGGTRLYGVIVDGVEEVANFTAADIEPTPDFGGAVDSMFITGMAKAGSGVKTLIDLDKISAVDGTIAIQALGLPSSQAS